MMEFEATLHTIKDNAGGTVVSFEITELYRKQVIALAEYRARNLRVRVWIDVAGRPTEELTEEENS